MNRNKIRDFYKFIGWRSVVWLMVGVVAGAILSFVDLALLGFLNLFLESLGLLSQKVEFSSYLDGITFTTMQLCFLLMGIGVIKGLATLIANQSVVLVRENFSARFKILSIYEMLLDPRSEYVPSSLVSYRISEIFPKASAFYFYAAHAIPPTVQCLVFGILLIMISWKLTLIAALGTGVIGLLVIQVNKISRYYASKTPQEHLELNNGIERTARNWLLVKILRTEQREYAQLMGNVMTYFSHVVRGLYLANIGQTVPPILGTILLVVIIYSSTSFIGVPGASLVAFLFLFYRLIQSLTLISADFGYLSNYLPQFKEALSYISKTINSDARDKVAISNNVSVLGRNKRSELNSSMKGGSIANSSTVSAQDASSPPTLSISNLSFRYAPDDNYIFNNINLNIEPGEHIGILGRSGTGKTTFLGLLLGVLKPSSGNVLIEGLAPSDYFFKYPGSIGYVGPEPFLLAGTIEENMSYGIHKQLPEKDYYDALEKAHLLTFVKGTKHGLQYKIRENGEGLSAGQKQRLSLARAFLTRPKILILDEASANLDGETEEDIATSVQNLKSKCTTIIVSHRPAMFKHIDRCFEFKNNSILAKPKDDDSTLQL